MKKGPTVLGELALVQIEICSKLSQVGAAAHFLTSLL